jgi:hypothetical protein
MKIAISLSKLPVNDFTYMGISSEHVYQIHAHDAEINPSWLVAVGVAYLNDMADKENSSYLEWVEVFDAFRGKKLLRPIMEKLTEECGTLYFEADEDLVKKYKAIGAVEYGKNEFTEQTQFYYGLTA